MAEPAATDNVALNAYDFREVFRNAWLKLIAYGCKKRERLWMVFCVHDDAGAYLEAYPDTEAANTHNPDWYVSMQNVKHITPTICPDNDEYEFVITLATDVIRLSAPSWQLMIGWVNTIKRKLWELRLMLPQENVYSKLPDIKCSDIVLMATRDPTSPLPPPPATDALAVPGTEAAAQTEPVTTSSNSSPPTMSAPHYEQLFISGQINTKTAMLRKAQRSTSNCERSRTPNTPIESVVLSMAQRLADTVTVSSQQIRQRRRSSSMSEAQGGSGRVTLRVQQVLQLKKEMQHVGGVRLEIRHKDCMNGMALVHIYNSVWIAGWKQREFPMLYNCLHIGDQVLSVQGRAVHQPRDVPDILKSLDLGPSSTIHLVVKRVPLGRVFAIQREREGQPLGLVQENGTAIIKQVVPGGLAARHGLPPLACSRDGQDLTNWVLTEINSRPLNLFYKDDEVASRLNCVGRDISILVQPLHFIKQLKKRLRMHRNFKDFLLQ